MLWVLQPDLYREHNYHTLVAAIERMGLPMAMVKPVPLTGRLIDVSVDCSKGVDVDETPEPELDTSKGVWCMGSYTLAKVAADRGWKPGAFIENLSYDVWSRAWPAEWLLNPGARELPFGDVVLTEHSFVRPVEDSKAFTGKVFSPEEFEIWRKRAVGVGSAQLTAETPVIVSAPKVIHSETRFFVVNRELVTWSGYKRGSTAFWTSRGEYHRNLWTQVDSEVIAFAMAAVNFWTPNEAFVMDVAQTPDGPRIIELNCLNAAGFYATDVAKLVERLEERFG